MNISGAASRIFSDLNAFSLIASVNGNFNVYNWLSFWIFCFGLVWFCSNFLFIVKKNARRCIGIGIGIGYCIRLMNVRWLLLFDMRFRQSAAASLQKVIFVQPNGFQIDRLIYQFHFLRSIAKHFVPSTSSIYCVQNAFLFLCGIA